MGSGGLSPQGMSKQRSLTHCSRYSRHPMSIFSHFGKVRGGWNRKLFFPIADNNKFLLWGWFNAGQSFVNKAGTVFGESHHNAYSLAIVYYPSFLKELTKSLSLKSINVWYISSSRSDPRTYIIFVVSIVEREKGWTPKVGGWRFQGKSAQPRENFF